ncbi:PRC and DUF2382 domain-containing protein [Nocardioides aurantiacus]|uniref:PRC and DUF2382 domain-containing protein n=1 Tax=Nocardioides aurantiacus TaxID=86796 RepID=UPI00403F5F39
MISTDQAQNLLRNKGNVVSRDGSKIGSVSQVFLDDESGRPEWVTVKTGLFGQAESFVPLSGAEVRGDDVVVPHDKDKVKDAPRVDDENGHLEPAQEQELFSYYGVSSVGDSGHTSGHTTGHDTGRDAAYASTGQTGTGDVDRTVGTGTHDHDRDSRGAGHDTSGPNTDDAMTRSEERVEVGTQTESAGKARLRKYVVTENVTQTVPVSHEEVRIEREPITDANRGDALSGGDITEEEHEVDLKQERVVVDKETVPVERVRLGKEIVTEEQTVDEQVRKEQIDTDGTGTTGTPDVPGDGR